MVACSSMKKNTCVSPCEWVRGKGCKSICPRGKILNPATDRCKKVKADAAKKECPPGKEYNPVTKRCKKIKTTRQKDTFVKPTYVAKTVKQSPIKCPHDLMSTVDNKSCVELELIDSGTAGCVITPSIIEQIYIIHTDIEYENPDNNDIAKIYKSGYDDYKMELDVLKFVQKIDPQHIFTTQLKAANHLSSDVFLYHSNDRVRSCLGNLPLSTYYQIVLDNGGKKLSTSYELTFKKFLHLFETFMQGLVLMQQHNIVHRDMKPANVLIKRDKISLIDFGLACLASDVYKSKNDYILSYHYPWYPPEFYVAHTIMEYMKDGYHIPEIVHNSNTILEYMTDDDYFEQSYMTSTYKEMYKRGIQMFLTTIKQQGYTEYKQIFTTEMALKADVFPIGHLLIALDKNIIYDNGNQQTFVEQLRDRCLDCNPYTRISMQEIHDAVKKQS